MLDIAFAKPALPKAGALVLLLAEEAAPTGLAAQLDTAMEGGLVRALGGGWENAPAVAEISATKSD